MKKLTEAGMGRAKIIARLEKLTGPDREVDCHIAVELSVVPDWWTQRAGETLYVKTSGAIGPEVAIQRAGKRKSSGDTPLWYTADVYRSDQRLLRYTASLDAAVALVEKMLPDTAIWSMGRFAVAEIRNDMDAPMARARAATPTIALLLALFRSLPDTEARHG